MGTKNILNIVIILLLPLFVYIFSKQVSNTYSVKAEKLIAIRESETTDPVISHLRVALNGYLNGTNDGISLPEFVINKGKTDKGMVLGLASFDKSYYASEFTTIKKENGPSYGQILTIFFDDKPDKLFDCWVYKKDNGEYDLRGFWENSKSAR